MLAEVVDEVLAGEVDPFKRAPVENVCVQIVDIESLIKLVNLVMR